MSCLKDHSESQHSFLKEVGSLQLISARLVNAHTILRASKQTGARVGVQAAAAAQADLPELLSDHL